MIQVPDVKYWVKHAAPTGCAIYIYIYILASPYAYLGEKIVEKKIWRSIKFVMLQRTLQS